MSVLQRFFQWISRRNLTNSLDHVRESTAMAKDIGVQVTRIPLASGGEQVIIERVIVDDSEE